jgi:hypothetical protein
LEASGCDIFTSRRVLRVLSVYAQAIHRSVTAGTPSRVLTGVASEDRVFPSSSHKVNCRSGHVLNNRISGAWGLEGPRIEPAVAGGERIGTSSKRRYVSDQR